MDNIYAFLFKAGTDIRTQRKHLKGHHVLMRWVDPHGTTKVVVGTRDYGDRFREVELGQGVSKLVPAMPDISTQ